MVMDPQKLWIVMRGSGVRLVKEVLGHKIVLLADFGGDEPVFVAGCLRLECIPKGKSYLPIYKKPLSQIKDVDTLFKEVEEAIKAHVEPKRELKEVEEIAKKYGYEMVLGYVER